MNRLMTGAIALTTTAIATVGVFLGLNAASQPAPKAENCPAYYVYAVRGTNDDPAPTGGLGHRFIDAFKNGLSSQIRVESGAADYPASGLLPDVRHIQANPGIPNPADRLYGLSEGSGRAAMMADLRALRNRCSATRTRVILEGYSQGANAIHDSYGELAPLGISDVVLFGDPLFCYEGQAENEGGGGTRSVASGDYDPHKRGLGTYMNVNQNCSQTDVRPPPGTKVWSYCDSQDAVCQGEGNLNPFDPNNPHYKYDAEVAARRVLTDLRESTGPVAYLSCTPGHIYIKASGSQQLTMTLAFDGASYNPMAIQDADFGIPAGTRFAFIKGPDGKLLDSLAVESHGCAPEATVSAPAPVPVSAPERETTSRTTTSRRTSSSPTSSSSVPHSTTTLEPGPSHSDSPSSETTGEPCPGGPEFGTVPNCVG